MTLSFAETYDFEARRWRGMVSGAGLATYASCVAAEEGISFGAACFSVGASGRIVAQSGSVFVGVATAGQADIAAPIFAVDPLNDGAVFDGYAANQTLSVLTRGTICVLAGSGVARDAPAYVTPAGAFTAVAAGNVRIPASFAEAATASSLVLLNVHGGL